MIDENESHRKRASAHAAAYVGEGEAPVGLELDRGDAIIRNVVAQWIPGQLGLDLFVEEDADEPTDRIAQLEAQVAVGLCALGPLASAEDLGGAIDDRGNRSGLDDRGAGTLSRPR